MGLFRLVVATCQVLLIVAITFGSAFSQGVSGNGSLYDTGEGPCKSGILDGVGHWDCRIVQTQFVCPDGSLGALSDDLFAIVSLGKPLSFLGQLIAKHIAASGVNETVVWLRCQGFDVNLNYNPRISTSSKKVLSSMTAHVWLQRDSSGKLVDLLRTWQATKDAQRCVLWLICEDPGEMSIKVEFDTSGNIRSTESYFHTEGL